MFNACCRSGVQLHCLGNHQRASVASWSSHKAEAEDGCGCGSGRPDLRGRHRFPAHGGIQLPLPIDVWRSWFRSRCCQSATDFIFLDSGERSNRFSALSAGADGLWLPLFAALRKVSSHRRPRPSHSHLSRLPHPAGVHLPARPPCTPTLSILRKARALMFDCQYRYIRFQNSWSSWY